MQVNQVEDLLLYLNDYFMVGPPDSSVCANNIKTMIATCEELGFVINPKNVTKSSTTTNFLGVDIGSVTMEAKIEPVYLSETTLLLEAILGLQFTTKWTILLPVGKLYFMCFVCRPHGAFLHYMIKHP